jgi:hypothetical protein
MIIAASVTTGGTHRLEKATEWALGSMDRGNQQADWLTSAVYRAMLWLFAVVLLGELHVGAGSSGVSREKASAEIGLRIAESQGQVLWAAQRDIAVLPSDREDAGAPNPDLAEAGSDSFAPADAAVYRWSSHRLALGHENHPAFADRPEAGASHARAPPSDTLSA